MKDTIKPPPLIWTSLEGVRASYDALRLLSERQFLSSLAKGDGHTIMVLPGFLAGDYSTIPIRYFLKKWGYATHGWNLGMNMGFNKRRDLEALMAEQLDKHYQQSGDKISLVGWSLGGLYARELARKHPEKVRMVISMGSPIGDAAKGAHTGGIYQFVTQTNFHDPEVHARIMQARKPVPKIPCTAIYSRSDGIVSWKIAMEKETDIAENIEVQSAHTGLGVNPAVMYAMADRLRQPEGDWKKFDKTQTDRYAYQ